MHKVFLSTYVWRRFVIVHLLCRPSASCEALPSFLRQRPACPLILQWLPGLPCWPPCQWEPRLSSSRVAWMKQCQISKDLEGNLCYNIENLDQHQFEMKLVTWTWIDWDMKLNLLTLGTYSNVMNLTDICRAAACLHKMRSELEIRYTSCILKVPIKSNNI